MAILLLMVKQGFAQNITIVNNYDGEDASVKPENYVLKSVSEHTYIINEYEKVNPTQGDNLQEMIEYSLRTYIDNNFKVQNSRVVISKSKDQILSDLKSIVQNAIWIYDFNFHSDFIGFNSSVQTQVAQFLPLDNAEVDFESIESFNSRSSTVGHYPFQRMVLNLKKTANKDVAEFLRSRVVITDAEPVVRIVYPDSDTSAFSKNERLTPYEIVLNPIDDNEPDLKDITLDLPLNDQEVNRTAGTPNGNTEQSVFNERVVQLLEENNKILAAYNNRFDDMQSQIDEIKQEKAAILEGENREIKLELSELRRMITALAEGSEYKAEDGTTTKRFDKAPVEIIFDKNVHKLNLDQRVTLNEVRETLLKEPGLRLLITGFADKTGDSDFNYWISQQRAQSVKKYLAASGINDQRLIVNFYGDSKAINSDPSDRKVKIEWLANDTSLLSHE